MSQTFSVLYKGYIAERTNDEWAISRGTPIRYYIDHEKVFHTENVLNARYEIDELTHDMEEPKTPITITGDVATLMIARVAFEKSRKKMIKGKWHHITPDSFTKINELIAAVDQAIKDQKHDDEQLPFKS